MSESDKQSYDLWRTGHTDALVAKVSESGSGNIFSSSGSSGSSKSKIDWTVVIIIVCILLVIYLWYTLFYDAPVEGFNDAAAFGMTGESGPFSQFPGWYNFTRSEAYNQVSTSEPAGSYQGLTSSPKQGYNAGTPQDGPFDRFNEWENYSQTDGYRCPTESGYKQGFVGKYNLEYKAPEKASIKSLGSELRFDDAALMSMNNPVMYDSTLASRNYVGIEAFDRGGGEVHDNAKRITDSMLMKDMLYNTGISNKSVKAELADNNINPITFKNDPSSYSLNYYVPSSSASDKIEGLTSRKVPVHPMKDGFLSDSKLLRKYSTR